MLSRDCSQHRAQCSAEVEGRRWGGGDYYVNGARAAQSLSRAKAGACEARQP